MKKKTKPTLKGETILLYLKKFPNITKASLARKIYKENSILFDNSEAVRTLIRKYTKSLGKASSKIQVKVKNTFKMPKSETVEKLPYIFPKKNCNTLIISDLHIPFHDVEAIESTLKYAVKSNVDSIIINGDLFDFYQLSRFEKDPKERNTAFEIDAVKKFFEYLRHLFPTQLIVWYYGNHDLRFKKFIYQKAPELLDIPEVELNYILGLTELNIIARDNNRGISYGKLNIRHGHEFFGSGGVFPARSYYLKAEDNILVSHVHRTSTYIATSIKREQRGGWSIGCLSELTPDYNINSKYNHGFAMLTKNHKGEFNVNNKLIINGKYMKVERDIWVNFIIEYESEEEELDYMIVKGTLDLADVVVSYPHDYNEEYPDCTSIMLQNGVEWVIVGNANEFGKLIRKYKNNFTLQHLN